MKLILRLFERVRPNFDDGGMMRPFKPVFAAAENFFFWTAARTPAEQCRVVS